MSSKTGLVNRACEKLFAQVHYEGLEEHLKQAAREAKLCARQLWHIQSPDLKLSGADPPEEACVAAELCSPPDLRCLHLQHADLEATLCARQPVHLQSPGRK